MENLKKIILMLVCAFPIVGSAQNVFCKKYTSGPFDQGNGVVQLSDMNYAITGSSGGFDENSGQAFLMLIDTLGNHLWTKAYGGPGDDVGMRVMHVPGDGFFIAGYTGSTLAGDFDFVLFKTDENGVLMWEKHYGGPNWEILHDAKLLSDGGLILVGQSEGPTTDGVDMFMVRTDALGDTIWTKTLQTSADDAAYAVDVLSASQFVVGGNLGDEGVSKGMIAGFNIDGTQEWLQYYDQHGISRVRDLTVYDNHIYIVGGLYNSGQTRIDIWYAKSDLNGNYIGHWTDAFGEDGMISAIAIRNDPNVFIALYTKSADMNPFIGGNDAFVFKLGTNMYFNNYAQNYSAVNDDIINQMIRAHDGGIVLVGTVSDDEVNLSLGTDVLIARIGPGDEANTVADTGMDLVSLTYEEKSVHRVYPNPTNDLIYFPENVQGLKYQVFDFQGKVVMKGSVEPLISLGKLNPGFYVIKVIDQNQVWSSKVLKY